MEEDNIEYCNGVAYRKFNTDEKVFVVSEPYKECPFKWVPGMDEFCGREVTIIRIREPSTRYPCGYKIEEDGERFIWCGNCFTRDDPSEPIIEESFDETQFLNMLGL